MTDESLRAWAAITATRGIGPAAVYRIAAGLRRQNSTAGNLLDLPYDEILVWMIRCGASEASGQALADSLTSAPRVVERPAGAEIIHPDSPEYPFERLDRRRPLPGLLYTKGAAFLLDQPAVAIVGSRDASDDDVGLARAVAEALAAKGSNIVSGHARGIDHAGHVGAIRSGGTTTAVLAEGINNFEPREGVVGDRHSTLVVSQFQPDARWRGHQAMARNATVAALVEAVVVIRSGDSGGTREMVKLCARTGLPTVAVQGRVPEALRSELTYVVAPDVDAVVQAVVGSTEASSLQLF